MNFRFALALLLLSLITVSGRAESTAWWNCWVSYRSLSHPQSALHTLQDFVVTRALDSKGQNVLILANQDHFFRAPWTTDSKFSLKIEGRREPLCFRLQPRTLLRDEFQIQSCSAEPLPLTALEKSDSSNAQDLLQSALLADVKSVVATARTLERKPGRGAADDSTLARVRDFQSEKCRALSDPELVKRFSQLADFQKKSPAIEFTRPNRGTD